MRYAVSDMASTNERALYWSWARKKNLDLLKNKFSPENMTVVHNGGRFTLPPMGYIPLHTNAKLQLYSWYTYKMFFLPNNSSTELVFSLCSWGWPFLTCKFSTSQRRCLLGYIDLNDHRLLPPVWLNYSSFKRSSSSKLLEIYPQMTWHHNTTLFLYP